MKAPRLTFFVELDSAALETLCENPEVLAFLVQGGHAVSMGLLDLDAGRARVVRRLEAAGVPVTAWLLLRRELGYWLTADNASEAVARYRQVHAWAQAEGLSFARVGLDIEAPRQHLEQLLEHPVFGLLARLRLRRAPAAIVAAEATYRQLVAEIRGHGRHVETYQFPVVLDERRAGSMLLRRALGLVHVAADTEVLMLYRSYFGRALVHAYLPEADGIALGVTGGGVNAERPDLEPKLRFSQLAQDLCDAARHSTQLYVFSLEGCVQHGMLPELSALDLDASTKPLARTSLWRARRVRTLLGRLCALERWLNRLLPDARAKPGRLFSRAYSYLLGSD